MCDNKCDTCPKKGSCGQPTAADPTELNLKIAASLKQFDKIFLILSGKGGVGKSTVATQLAFYISSVLKQKTCLMDVDVCGPSIPTMTNTVGQEVHASADGWAPVGVSDNLQVISIGFMLGNVNDAVILRGPKKHGLIAQFLSEVIWDLEEGSSHYLIIDTPPGTTDEHLSTVNLISQCTLLLDEADRPKLSSIIVSTPQEVALSDVRKELDFCKKLFLHVTGVIENMSGFVCPCCGKETQIFTPTSGGCARMAQEANVRFLGRIPMDPLLMKAGEEGKMWSTLVGEGQESVGLKMFGEIAKLVLE